MTIKVSALPEPDKEGLEAAEGLSEPSYCRSLKSEERLINLHNAKVAASMAPVVTNRIKPLERNGDCPYLKKYLVYRFRLQTTIE
jgi:hypothetical protein